MATKKKSTKKKKIDYEVRSDVIENPRRMRLKSGEWIAVGGDIVMSHYVDADGKRKQIVIKEATPEQYVEIADRTDLVTIK